MFKHRLTAAAVALACACPAFAQDAEIAKIREEIRQMKETYERRIQTLEKRLAEADARTGRADATAPGTPTPATAAAGRSGETAFNPAISLILQGAYARTSKDPNTFEITGFVPSGGEVGPPVRAAYNDPRAAEWLASRAGIPASAWPKRSSRLRRASTPISAGLSSPL